MSGTGQQPPNQFAAALAAAVQAQQANHQAEEARRQRDAIVEIQSAAYDKGMAYTNLILLGGYAGAFAIWSNTKDQLNHRATILIAILLAISLTIFVFFEVFKMIFETRRALKLRALVVRQLPPASFLAELSALRIDINTNGLKWLMPIWVGQLIVVVATALAAIGLLFFNFFAILLCFSQWPT